MMPFAPIYGILLPVMPKRIETPNKTCEHCGLSFNRSRLRSGRIEAIEDYSTRRYCSKRCWGKSILGSNHPGWKGGTKTRPDGYIRDSRTDKYIHRVVLENKLGRSLTSEEHVHHINGDKKDNRPENLEIHTNSSHRKLECKTQKRGSDGKFTK